MADSKEKDNEKPEQDATERESSPESMTEEELRDKLEEQFRRQKVSDLLMQYLVGLSSLAYVKMGITEDTQDIKDLDQARMAIDAFKALLDSVGDRLDRQDTQALAGALASMQMTFVQASGGGQSGGEGAGDEAEASGESGGESAPEGGDEKQKRGDDPASRLWVPGKD